MTQTSRWPLPLLFLVLLIGGFPSCVKVLQAKKLIADAIPKFHAHYNAEEFKQIYNEGHPDFRGAAKESDFVELLQNSHTKLGNFVATISESGRANTLGKKIVITMLVTSTFEKGTAVETFRYEMVKDKALLRAYFIELKSVTSEK